MKKTTNGFPRLSIAEFEQQAYYIANRMTGNADFTGLQTQVQGINAKIPVFDELVELAKTGSKRAGVDRDAARLELTDLLHDLGADVDAVAKGNEALLISSGFPYTQDRKPSPNMQQQPAPKVSQGVNIGEIDCRTTTQPGMKSVNYYITADPAAATLGADVKWDVYSSNSVKYTFTGLTSGVRYYIKVGLVGVRGQEVISNPVTYIPQ